MLTWNSNEGSAVPHHSRNLICVEIVARSVQLHFSIGLFALLACLAAVHNVSLMHVCEIGYRSSLLRFCHYLLFPVCFTQRTSYAISRFVGTKYCIFVRFVFIIENILDFDSRLSAAYVLLYPYSVDMSLFFTLSDIGIHFHFVAISLVFDWFRIINRCLPLNCESKPIDFQCDTIHSHLCENVFHLSLSLDRLTIYIIVDCFQFVIYDFCFCRRYSIIIQDPLLVFTFCLFAPPPHLSLSLSLPLGLSLRIQIDKRLAYCACHSPMCLPALCIRFSNILLFPIAFKASVCWIYWALQKNQYEKKKRRNFHRWPW